jgi:general secretion pathway protein B
MSYILEALRRAESERERGKVPGLHSQAWAEGAAAAPASGRPGARRSAQPLLIGGLVLLLLAGAGAYMWWSRPAPAPAPVLASAEPAPPPAPAASVALSPPPPVPAAASALPLPPPPVVLPALVPAPAPDSTPAPAARPAAPIPTLAELSPALRAELPPLQVGGAMHSDTPANRMLILNGQVYREGDAIAPGLQLEQIQLRSAVLLYKGQRLRLSY